MVQDVKKEIFLFFFGLKKPKCLRMVITSVTNSTFSNWPSFCVYYAGFGSYDQLKL